MKGARKYCELFKKAEQIGRLYILPHFHARGKTFSIFVLRKNESVIENHGINPPLNNGAVEVYGVVSGNLGWTESYGWIHHGKWVSDFEKIVAERQVELDFQKDKNKVETEKRRNNENEKIEKNLRSYGEQ